ncbi:MAG: hypothetical protein ABR962_06595 [Candidatus Bathyarchaeia archaeon]
MVNNSKMFLYGALIVLLLVSPLIVICPKVLAQNTPVFISEDALIPSLGLYLTHTPIFPYTISQAKGGGVEFSPSYEIIVDRANDYQIDATFDLLYFNDPGNASAFFQNTVNQLYTSTIEQAVKNEPTNTVIESDFQGATYRTLIFMHAETSPIPPYGDGKALAQYDAHYVYTVTAHGNGFTGGAQLQQMIHMLVDHCQSVIEAKEGLTGTFVISQLNGDISVQRGASGPWIPAENNMVIHPADAIKAGTGAAVTTNSLKIDYYAPNSPYPISVPMFGIVFREGVVVLLTAKDIVSCTVATNSITGPYMGIMHFSSSQSHNPLVLEMDQMNTMFTITDTDFELVGNSSETTLYTFNGTVQVSDLTGNNTFTVGANQTATIATGGVTTGPTAFDPTTVDQWWTSAVPEFQDYAILTLFMLSTLVAMILSKKKYRPPRK